MAIANLRSPFSHICGGVGGDSRVSPPAAAAALDSRPRCLGFGGSLTPPLALTLVARPYQTLPVHPGKLVAADSWKGFPFNWEGGAGHLFQVPTVDPKRAMTLSIQKVPESPRNGDIWERPSKDLLVELFLGDLPNSYSDVVLMLLTAAMQRIELDVVEGGIFKQGDCLVARYYVNQGNLGYF